MIRIATLVLAIFTSAFSVLVVPMGVPTMAHQLVTSEQQDPNRDGYNLNMYERQVQSWIVKGSPLSGQFVPSFNFREVRFRALPDLVKQQGGCPTFKVPGPDYPYGFQAVSFLSSPHTVSGFVTTCQLNVTFDGSQPTTRQDFVNLVKAWCMFQCAPDNVYLSPKTGLVTFISSHYSCPYFRLDTLPYISYAVLDSQIHDFYPGGYEVVCRMTVDFTYNQG